MRTARQISAQAKKLRNAKEVEPTKLITPNARIVEKLSQPIIIEPKFPDGSIISRYNITNPNGYTEEQLNTPLPREDYEFIEKGIVIPVNYGMGIEVEYNGEKYIFKRGGSGWRSKPTVSLEISTWRGVSFGAMHYYGKLNLRLPEMTEVGRDGWTCSTYIPMFGNDDIKLTQVLEQWEIDKYPDNYEYNRAGERHDGFYTMKQLKDYAEEVFQKIFEKGWNFRIEER